MRKILGLVLVIVMIFSLSIFADTATPTATATATPSFFNYKVAQYSAWIQDVFNNTTNAVAAYDTAAEKAESRGDLKNQAWMLYSKANVTIKSFRNDLQYVQNLKRIRLIVAPVAEATAAATYCTVVQAFTARLAVAETPIAVATALAQSAPKNKLVALTAYIAEIRTWVAAHD